MRFLWYTDPTKPEKVEGNLSTYHFCRIPFGLICSPFLLKETVRFYFNSRVAKAISNSKYADNVCVGANSIEETLHIYSEAKGIRDASINLQDGLHIVLNLSKYLPSKEV